MATVYGTNAGLRVNTPSTLVEKVDDGEVYCFRDTYELAALPSADVIVVGYLPVGAKVVDVVFANDALGASTTIVIGDSVDPNRYVTSQDTSTAGVARLNAITGMDYTILAATREIWATLGGGTGTGTISVNISYTF